MVITDVMHLLVTGRFPEVNCMRVVHVTVQQEENFLSGEYCQYTSATASSAVTTHKIQFPAEFFMEFFVGIWKIDDWPGFLAGFVL